MFAIGQFRKKGAGVSVDTKPASTVFIDGEQVGRTPYEGVKTPGEVTIKLLPDSFEKPLSPYETKVTLTAEVQTVIKREFGETEDLSSGAIVSFEKVGSREVSISVVSIPDGAEVSLNGQVRGFTPFKTSSINDGNHQLSLSALGFNDYQLNVRTYAGYKVTAVFKLAPGGVVEEAKDEIVEELKVQEVEILTTGTGFLRVRAGPSVLEAEVGRVGPGKRYPLVESDVASGWFKIEYEEGKEGWVSNEYAKIVERTPSPSPTATATPKTSPKPSPTPSPR